LEKWVKLIATDMGLSRSIFRNRPLSTTGTHSCEIDPAHTGVWLDRRNPAIGGSSREVVATIACPPADRWSNLVTGVDGQSIIDRGGQQKVLR